MGDSGPKAVVPVVQGEPLQREGEPSTQGVLSQQPHVHGGWASGGHRGGRLLLFTITCSHLQATGRLRRYFPSPKGGRKIDGVFCLRCKRLFMMCSSTLKSFLTAKRRNSHKNEWPTVGKRAHHSHGWLPPVCLVLFLPAVRQGWREKTASGGVC